MKEPGPNRDGALAALVQAAAARWPELTVPAADFERFLLAKLPGGGSRLDAAALARLNVIDLYLAYACLDGQPQALRLLDACAVGVVESVLARRKDLRFDADHARRTLMRVMVVGDDGVPRLTRYGGRGSLANWMRVVVLRLALNDAASRWRERPLDDAALAALVSPGDQELDNIRRLYRPALEVACREALAARPARDRALMRLHFLESMPCEQVAQVYRVHTSTAWRWLEAAKRELRAEIVRRLATHLGVGTAEAESLTRLVASEIEISTRRILAESR